MLAKIPFDHLKDALLKHGSCEVDLLSSALRLYDLDHPMLDFSLKNLSKIKSVIKRDIVIFRRGNHHTPLYKVRQKYDETLNFIIDESSQDTAVFKNFEVSFNKIETIHMCRKTESCNYTTAHLPHLQRHEKNCTDLQETVTQQVAYGNDKTPIKELVELGYLPEEALLYRKTFFTAFDIGQGVF